MGMARDVALSVKETVPLMATPPAGAVRVAVNVTDWSTGVEAEVWLKARLVAAGFTVCVNCPGDTVKLESPL